MRSPIHLWSGRWREESERARRAAAGAPARRQPADTDEFEALRPPAVGANGAGPRPAAGQPRLAGRRAGVVIAILALLAIGGGAFTAGTPLERDNQPPPLPAVSTAPVKPKKGQSPAEAVYAAASPAVVSVRTAEGAGTGFLIDRKGNLVTNAHVAGNDKRVTVRFGDGASI